MKACRTASSKRSTEAAVLVVRLGSLAPFGVFLHHSILRVPQTAGKVQLVAKGEPMSQQYCHCDGCRQYHSAPFIGTLLFNSSNVEIVSGETECFKVNNTPELTRLSCAKCRTPVMNLPVKFPQIRVTFPMLFKDVDFKPAMHIWWSHHTIQSEIDELPKYDAWAPM